MPPTGREDVHPPEKQQHTQHLNAALAKALREWNPQDGTEVVIRFEASVSENPGGGISTAPCLRRSRQAGPERGGAW
jgi:hypothetical protein